MRSSVRLTIMCAWCVVAAKRSWGTRMAHITFARSAVCYWVAEAMGSTYFVDSLHTIACMLARNTVALRGFSRSRPIPAKESRLCRKRRTAMWQQQPGS